MDMIIAGTALAIFGVVLGSFAGATVWRLRAVQLREDEASGEKVDRASKKEIQQLKRTSVLNDRSICLHCGHQLAWYDLVPLFSWLQLRGKCRYCHKHIGNLEPLIELGLGLYFVLSYFFWPQPFDTTLEVIRFGIWLVAGVGLAILVAYDAKWFLLPNQIMFPVIGLGFLSSIIALAQENFSYERGFSILYACFVLSGLYYAIYIASRQQWVGFGDVKLGLALALLLADWRLAVLALFLANAIGSLLLLPLIFLGKIKRQTHVPFGPLLVAGWAIAGLFGGSLITWYLGLTLGV